MRRSRIAIIFCFWFAAFACTSETAAVPTEACTDVLPTCPDAGAPTYSKDVAPLFASACVTCHVFGGPVSNRPLDVYTRVFAQRGPVLNQLHACKMPPPDGPPLSAADRTTIETWLVCGARND